MAASNMEEALAAIQKEEFDAVISDITVKRGVKTQAEEQAEGYIFAVKARQAGYKGPIALCTGYGADHPDLQKLVSAGVATMGVSKTDVFTDVPGLIGRLESVVVSETPADTLAKYAGAVGRGDMTVFSGGNEAKGPAAPPAGLLQQAETLLRATRHEVNNKINGLSYLGLLSEMMSDGGPTRENDGLRGLLRAMNVISERCLAINDRVNGIPKKITTADEAAAGLRTMIDGYEEMSLLIEQTAARTAELEALLERNDGTRQYVKQARGILQVNEAKQVIDSSIPAADKLFAEIRGTAGLPRGISIFNERIRHDINNKISGMGDLYLLRGDISERRVPDGDGTIARVAADIENVYEELVVLQKSIMEIPKVVPGQADARDTIRSAAEKYAAVKLILAQIQEKSRHLLGLMQTAQYPDRDKYFRTLFENMDRMISETAVLIDHFIWSAQQKLGAAAPATVAADGAGKAVEEKPAREEARAPVGKEPAVLRILVVDDEEQLRKMLEMQLNMAGHIVTGVPGSADALAKVGAGEVFDVMIVDATLGPSESGFELIRKLREIERDAGSHSFIVGISGNENADQFSVAGADRFLHKPFMRADLKSALADAAPAAVVEAGAKVSPEKPVREKAPVPVEKQPAGLRILVVDDEAGNRESLDFALGMAGHAVTGAASAPEALARIDAGEKFDIIMIDVNLGVGGNGIKLIRKIREIERRAGGRQSFIIALSGDDASALCVEAGANRFFPKPAEIRSLIELIEKSVPVRAAPLPPLIKSGEETDSYDKGKKESLDPAA
jgi:CheY-like chemotaxis protein